MFQFPAFALHRLMQWRNRFRRVSPFGHLRITEHLPLPAAFRSLSRPSSALSAKASTLRSFLFDLPVLIAFKTGGSLACLHTIVFTIEWAVVCLIRYLLLKITPRMSFPISKRLTFFGLFFVYAVFKVHTGMGDIPISDWCFISHQKPETLSSL